MWYGALLCNPWLQVLFVVGVFVLICLLSRAISLSKGTAVRQGQAPAALLDTVVDKTLALAGKIVGRAEVEHNAVNVLILSTTALSKVQDATRMQPLRITTDSVKHDQCTTLKEQATRLQQEAIGNIIKAAPAIEPTSRAVIDIA